MRTNEEGYCRIPKKDPGLLDKSLYVAAAGQNDRAFVTATRARPSHVLRVQPVQRQGVGAPAGRRDHLRPEALPARGHRQHQGHPRRQGKGQACAAPRFRRHRDRSELKGRGALFQEDHHLEPGRPLDQPRDTLRCAPRALPGAHGGKRRFIHQRHVPGRGVQAGRIFRGRQRPPRRERGREPAGHHRGPVPVRRAHAVGARFVQLHAR